MPVTICYSRVSTEEQARSGLSLSHQKDICIAEAVRRGRTEDEICVIVDDGYSAKNLGRPGIKKALKMLASGMRI